MRYNNLIAVTQIFRFSLWLAIKKFQGWKCKFSNSRTIYTLTLVTYLVCTCLFPSNYKQIARSISLNGNNISESTKEWLWFGLNHLYWAGCLNVAMWFSYNLFSQVIGNLRLFSLLTCISFHKVIIQSWSITLATAVYCRP